MSLIFNDTTNYKGIIQLIEREAGFNRGDISGDTNRLKDWTADVNMAMDDFTKLAIEASGTWQYDDSNHTDYPILTVALEDGQRDYSFTLDGSGNLILDIYRVFVKPSATATNYVEIFPKDQQSERGTEGYTDGQNVEGVPYTYDKTGNGIFLDPIPSYDAAAGLKLYVNREGSYFTSSDTTKKPGVPGLFHRYLALRPAEDYARRNGKPSYTALRAERMQMEEDIKAYYGRRERDVRKRITNKPIKFI
jgi:hypothetical protein